MHHHHMEKVHIHNCDKTQSVHITNRYIMHMHWQFGISGNALVSINEVALHWAQLLLGWVNVCGQVNYLSM